MYRKMLIIALLAAVSLLTSCSQESEPSVNFNNERHLAALERYFGKAYTISETSPQELTYHYDEQLGGIAVTNYHGESTQVKIPQNIDGYPVVSVDLRYCYKYISDLILPDSIENVRIVSYNDIVGYIKGEDITPARHLPHYHVAEIHGIVIDSYLGTSKKVRISDIQWCNKHAPEFPTGEYHVDMLYFRELEADIDMLILSDDIDTVYEGAFSDVIIYESTLDSYLSCAEKVKLKYTKIGVERMNIPTSFDLEESYAFANSTLTSVFIPENITCIGDHVFSQSPLLAEVVYNADEISVGQQAFYCCDSLADIDMSRIAAEGKWAFYGCSQLDS